MPSKYIVLRSAPPNHTSPGQAVNGQNWRVEKMVDAANAKAAVAAVVKDLDIKEGTFIATPFRSWKQVKVQVETTPRVKFT